MEKEYDVVVVGGGPAGVPAAIAAARLGCSVALIQDRPVLGGNSSSEIRVPIGGACDFNPWARETGILEELFLEDRVQNARRVWLGEATSLWDLVLYNAVLNAGIDLHLETSARSVVKNNNNPPGLAAVLCVQNGTEVEFDVHGKLFIDATGDGTVAFRAGAETRMGREARAEFDEALAPEQADEYTMGASLLFHATDVGVPVPFRAPDWVPEYRTDTDLNNRTHDDITAGYWWIEVGNPPYNSIEDNNKIRHELTRQLLAVWNHIKSFGDHGAANLFLDWFGSVPGKRESRRITGDYILKESDLKGSRLFDDRVAYGGWFVDLHVMGGILTNDQPPEPSIDGNLEERDKRQMYTYSIPFRCLYSKDIPNLMMAGRNISTTHVALGSTRLMATCAVVGQAAGTAAALCTKHQVSPKDLCRQHIQSLQQLLLKSDCYVPSIKNEDPEDLARSATVTASSSAALHFKDGEIGFEYEHPKQKTFSRSNLDTERAQLFPVSGDRIERVEVLIESRSDRREEVELRLHPARAIWDFSSKDRLKEARAQIEAHCLSWIGFDLNTSVEPGRLYWIAVKSAAQVYWRYSQHAPTGTASASRIIRNWSAQKGAYSMRILPESWPYKPENLLSGVTRPEAWTNLWVSDPCDGFPQYVEYDFDKAVTFNLIQLIFDTNLHMAHMATPALYRFPECVRHYVVYTEQGGVWKPLVEVKDNYQRRREHRFEPLSTNKLRIEILGTNGNPSARLYEVRVYQNQD